jgi:hypothetical protein
LHAHRLLGQRHPQILRVDPAIGIAINERRLTYADYAQRSRVYTEFTDI